MTQQESVSISAKKLDKIKPNWYKLVPLEDGKINMGGQCQTGVECILDYVFMEESKETHLSGYFFGLNNHLDLVFDTVWAPFAADEALPFWKQEISARLAVWTPVKAKELINV